MKNFFLCLLATMTLMTMSCGDACDDVDCGPGVCVEGTCDCPEGFVGTNCETEVRAKFVGTWNSVNFVCDGEAEDVTLIIVEGEGALEIVITDPDQLDLEVTTTVNGDNFVIEPQQILIGGGILVTVSGSGSLMDGVMTIDILQDAPGFGTITCMGTFMQ